MYLLHYLRGELHRFASGLQLTDANYFVVLDMLEERYGNTDMLRNLLLGEFVDLRPPSNEVADLYRFHDEAFRVTSELKQLGEDVDATHFYEQILMSRLSEKLRFKLIQNYGCDRVKSVSAILDGLRRYTRNRELAMKSGNLFAQRQNNPPDAPRQERRSPPARSPSECNSEESTECSEDASAEQPTTCAAKAVSTNVATRRAEDRWRCQLCGHPHVANNCTTYTTVNQRLRRAQKLRLCLHCLSEGHRADSCPWKGTDFCRICQNGNHHRAFCMAAADGTESEPLHGSSKCATCGSTIDRKRSVPKRLPRETLEVRPATTSASAARKLRPGAHRSPARILDNPNKRHAPVKKAAHRSDSRISKSTAPRKVPPSAPRQDRENKPRASPTTQGPSGDGTNSTKIYRMKKSGNHGTRSQGRVSTTPPSTTSPDESKQNGAAAYGNASFLAARPDLLQTDRCSTNLDSPQHDRPGAGPDDKSPPHDEGPWWDVRPEEDVSMPESIGHCSNAPTVPSDAYPDDERFPTYKEVRAYVASASTDDAQAPLLECLEVTAAIPSTGAARKGIVFFDPGSTFSYISPELSHDLNLPHHGKCVRRVHTFGSLVPTTIEGFSTSVVLGAPRGHQVSLGAIIAHFAIPSVRTALVEDSNLPSLRRNERSVSPTRVTPDILIGQDRIQLFGRQHGSRLPAGYDVVHTIFGPTISGAPQVVTDHSKAAPISCAAAAADDSGPHPGSTRQQPPDTTDASALQTIVLPSTAPSNRLTSPETESPTSKPDPALLAEQGLDVPPQQATDHPCLQNELQGDATSTTFCAERQSLPERMERSELLQRTPNPLDTELPLQSGPHTTSVVLKPELQLGQQRSAECNKQRDHRLTLLPQHPPLRSFNPPTHPVEAAHRARYSETSSIAARALVPLMSPEHQAAANETIHTNAPPAAGDTDASADSTDDRHLQQHQSADEDTHYIPCVATAAAANASASSTVLLTGLDCAVANTAIASAPASNRQRPRAFVTDLLSETDSASAQAATTTQNTATRKKSGASDTDLLSESDSAAATITITPKQPAKSSKTAPSGTVLLTDPDSGAREPASPSAEATTSQAAEQSASDTDLLSESDNAATQATTTPKQPAIQKLSNSSVTVLLTETESAALKACVTLPHDPAKQTLFEAFGTVLLTGSDSEAAEATTSAEDATITQKTASASLTPAQASRCPVARADPLDQEANTTRVVPIVAFSFDSEQHPASLPTSLARRTPAEAALDRSASFVARSKATPDVPAVKQQTSVARPDPAEAALKHAASPDDATRVRRTYPDDSPLKKESVCFCDETTFLHFGRLLRPEVLMIPTPVPSLEDALQSVYDFHSINEVSRVIFWFSDSHATPLSPAVQLRLVVELSHHYATHYPTVMQYVVATPSIGSRQDVWTYGLLKLLVQMQVLLPNARLMMYPRGVRSVTYIDVYYLKLDLRDQHHLDLWGHYDADIPLAEYSASRQDSSVRATLPTLRKRTAKAKILQRKSVLPQTAPSSNTGGVAYAAPKDGSTNAVARDGSSFLSGKNGRRHRDDWPKGSAARPIAQFPPPPSFHATLLLQHSGSEGTWTTGSTPLADPALARKQQPRSSSKPALLAVRESAKTNTLGKKKEHLCRDEKHHRSKSKRAPAAPADTSKQPVKRKPNESRPGLLSVVDQTEAETVEHRIPAPRRNICVFCAHTHWAPKCTLYRSRTQRTRRARELGYCFICLRVGHTAQACPSRTPSSCQICKQGQHHRALCPLAPSITVGAKQTPLRRPPPSAGTPSPTTTMRTSSTKIAKNRRRPDRSAHSTDAPLAARTPLTPEPAKAHHRRKPRKRKDREPRT